MTTPESDNCERGGTVNAIRFHFFIKLGFLLGFNLKQMNGLKREVRVYVSRLHGQQARFRLEFDIEIDIQGLYSG